MFYFAEDAVAAVSAFLREWRTSRSKRRGPQVEETHRPQKEQSRDFRGGAMVASERI